MLSSPISALPQHGSLSNSNPAATNLSSHYPKINRPPAGWIFHHQRRMVCLNRFFYWPTVPFIGHRPLRRTLVRSVHWASSEQVKVSSAPPPKAGRQDREGRFRPSPIKKAPSLPSYNTHYVKCSRQGRSLSLYIPAPITSSPVHWSSTLIGVKRHTIGHQAD